ncbi:MAG: mechanosensitive ion channel, partial [Nitrospirae bacterium]|nr:mechanosensitive ion channel [Nitrospirota bacterium]
RVVSISLAMIIVFSVRRRATSKVIGAMMILSELGVDLKPVLAAAGLGRLAIGCGAQSLVKDVITGLSTRLANQVRVGDVAQRAGVGGFVEEVRQGTITLIRG